MKLRILGNKLRFRVTQNEIKSLEEGKTVSETSNFMNGGSLEYRMVPSNSTSTITTSYEQNLILVCIPNDLLQGWAMDDREGLYSKELADGHSLEASIEKDYQCLHKRVGEDEGDHFPNPIGKRNN